MIGTSHETANSSKKKEAKKEEDLLWSFKKDFNSEHSFKGCPHLKRIHAMKIVKMVAATVGCKVTREQLLPLLQSTCIIHTNYIFHNLFFVASIKDGEMDVLVPLSESLGKLGDCIGGTVYADCLLQPLGILAASHFKEVQTAAISSINTILKSCSDAENAEDTMLPLLKRLAAITSEDIEQGSLRWSCKKCACGKPRLKLFLTPPPDVKKRSKKKKKRNKKAHYYHEYKKREEQ